MIDLPILAAVVPQRFRCTAPKAAAWLLALMCLSPFSAAIGQTVSTPKDNVPAANGAGFAVRYPAGSITSVEMANRALVDAEQTRKAILAQFSEDERICYPKFFASSCMEDAKERRRVALAQLRPVEVEAGRYKRNAQAVEHDKELEEKRLREELEAPRRLIEQQQHEQAAVKKAESHGKAEKTEAELQAATDLANAASAKRIAKHDAKIQRETAERSADAKKRAENIANFEKKQSAAQARQADIAARKLAKEKKAQQKNQPVIAPAPEPAKAPNTGAASAASTAKP
jgi:hypothetical protein